MFSLSICVVSFSGTISVLNRPGPIPLTSFLIGRS